MIGCCVASTTRKAWLRSNRRIATSNPQKRRTKSPWFSLTAVPSYHHHLLHIRRWRIACTSTPPTQFRSCTRRTQAAPNTWCHRNSRAKCKASPSGTSGTTKKPSSFLIITSMPLLVTIIITASGPETVIIKCFRCRISSCTCPSPFEYFHTSPSCFVFLNIGAA